jgi:P-type Mg2+ transporter
MGDGRQSAVISGLSSDEAAARLAEQGPNEVSPVQRRATLREVVAMLTNPLALILLVAGIISAILGETVNAAIIIAIVVLSSAVNLWQTWRSRRSVDRLRLAVTATATVLRDGEFREIARREIVLGDVVRLTAGDLVPADARLIDARDLHVQQAALTGESLPAEKGIRPAGESPSTGPDAADRVFLGTSVVSGTATAVVTATGLHTMFGEIAARLVEKVPETEFERGLRHFGGLILRVVFFLVLFILAVNLALHRPAFESLLFAVALAVGLTPEFLPMITTVTLGEGAVRMARAHVIVKHLAAIQNFGSIDILCSDKTGTLTEGEMTVERSLDASGAPSPRPLALAEINGTLESGIKSALDRAIIAGAKSDVSAWRKLDELPFDFERRRASIVATRDGERILVCKGAPESVLAVCDRALVGGRVVPLDDAARARCRAVYEHACGEGLRVLAVGSRDVPEQPAYDNADEAQLVLAGFVTFADPPRSDARDAIAALARDGVQVKILTGDNELVARHVCAEVGLDVTDIVLGSDIDRMTDGALGHVAERTTVFARVAPAQKSRIILALKRRGHVVGCMGDGINDAPSLHAADVGISVFGAVDVARDAAEIILLEPGLRVLHAGILAGRRAFGNVMKYLLMGTSSNFGNMLSMAVAALFLPFLPMLPTQILLNNFLYDLAQITIPTDRVDGSWVRTPQRWDLRVIRNFMLIIGPISSAYDFVTFFVLLRVFHAGESLFHTGWFVESLATQTLVLFVIRTAGNPLRSRASWPLTFTTLAVVAVGVALPFTPFAELLGFVPLPVSFFVFLAVMTATYLGIVELVKRRLLRRVHGPRSSSTVLAAAEPSPLTTRDWRGARRARPAAAPESPASSARSTSLAPPTPPGNRSRR